MRVQKTDDPFVSCRSTPQVPCQGTMKSRVASFSKTEPKKKKVIETHPKFNERTLPIIEFHIELVASIVEATNSMIYNYRCGPYSKRNFGITLSQEICHIVVDVVIVGNRFFTISQSFQRIIQYLKPHSVYLDPLSVV